MFLNCLKMEFEYSLTSLYNTFSRFAEMQMSGNFICIKKCLSYIDDGCDFPIAFSKAVKEERFYTADEKRKLISFGNSLGTSCVDTQINLIGYYIEMFERKYEECRSTSENKSKTALLFCTFIGLGFYIITV